MDTPQTLAAAMLKAAAEAAVGARVVVQASAKTIRNEARKNVKKSAPVQNAHAMYAITYNTGFTKTGVDAEIGYDKDINGGPLGNLLEYGGGGDKSPPHRDLGRALDAEQPRFESALSKLPGIAL